MTLEELIQQFRLITDDVEAPYLWSDEELEFFFNEAELEACRRARLLVSTNLPEICRINVVAGQKSYDLDPKIIYIRRAKLASKAHPIRPVNVEKMDALRPGWEDHTGSVEAYVVGMESGKIVLYRNPSSDDTLTLTVVREPLDKMKLGMESSPEIPERYHASLIHWALYKAYSKKDAETNDKELASINIAEFVREFGKRELASSLEEEWLSKQSYEFNIGEF
jgi:hypothetical protein